MVFSDSETGVGEVGGVAVVWQVVNIWQWWWMVGDGGWGGSTRAQYIVDCHIYPDMTSVVLMLLGLIGNRHEGRVQFLFFFSAADNRSLGTYPNTCQYQSFVTCWRQAPTFPAAVLKRGMNKLRKRRLNDVQASSKLYWNISKANNFQLLSHTKS